VNCIEVLEQLADYLDDDARADLCDAINEHLQRCPDCRIQVETVRRTIVLYKAEPQVETPTAITLRLDDVLKRAYRSGPEPRASD
jgi:predicted anti-sigma-YlaC factor YlaD